MFYRTNDVNIPRMMEIRAVAEYERPKHSVIPISQALRKTPGSITSIRGTVTTVSINIIYVLKSNTNIFLKSVYTKKNSYFLHSHNS